MTQIPGFDISNVDQAARNQKQQENINRSVMAKQIKIVSFPNPRKLSNKEVAEYFLKEVVRYDNSKDINCLCWIKGAERVGELTSIRAEMSYSFWEFFMEVGKRNLAEYNRAHNSSIRVLREHTIQIADLENLSLYLRRKIRRHCIEHKLLLPEIQVRKGEMVFKNNTKQMTRAIKSTTLAILLGWDYSDWSGVPIKNMLSDLELKEYQAGKLEWGSMEPSTLFELNFPYLEERRLDGVEYPIKSSRKREFTVDAANISKQPRLNDEENNPIGS